MFPSSENFEELRYTQQLGDPDVNVQNKAVQKLKKFLNLKSAHNGFSYEDFIKTWKGLYYCMYLSDKPLVQEDLAEKISNLIHCISTNSQKILFFKASLDTLAREWNGIDKYRYDKFLMLVTRIVRQMLIFLSKISWNRSALKETCEVLESQIICPGDDKNDKPQELKMHIADVILEELAKVGKEVLPDRVLIAVICPFLKVLAISRNNTYVVNVTNRILHMLIKQSKLGIKYEEDITSREVSVLPKKTKERKSSDSKGESESDDEETEEKDENSVMDPRIGGIDVHLPFLRPNYIKVASAIESVAHNPAVSQQRRKKLVLHARKFRLLSEGVYPFNFPEVDHHLKQKDVAKKALKRLLVLDEEISSKRSKLMDEDEIEDIENYLSEEAGKSVQKMKRKKNKGEISKKKEANIARSLSLKKKKKRRLRKLSKYQNNPGSLHKFLEKEKEEKLKKQNHNFNKDKNDVNSTSFDVNTPIKSKVKVKTCLQENKKSSNVINKESKDKGGVIKLKSSNSDKVTGASAEKIEILKCKKADKNSRGKTDNKGISWTGSVSSPKLQARKINNENSWTKPLKEGEIEFEVTRKKYSKKVKSAMLMRKTPNRNTKGKTLKINLKQNTEHEFGDYKVAIKQSPGIPYSAKKKPLSSVLKSSSGPSTSIKKSKKINSRINFIRRKSKL